MLWSQRCEQPRSPEFWARLRSAELSSCFVSAMNLCIILARGVNGLVGEEFKDMIDGGEVNDAGARTVNVRSLLVKFEA